MSCASWLGTCQTQIQTQDKLYLCLFLSLFLAIYMSMIYQHQQYYIYIYLLQNLDDAGVRCE